MNDVDQAIPQAAANNAVTNAPTLPVQRKTTSRQRHRSRRASQRQAAIIVWFALMLPLLLGMTGLVIDAGLLMAAHRHVQNSADAAAMAGAKDLLSGLTVPEAVATSHQFVKSHHRLDQAKIDVYIPPANGPYAGEAGFVEVIVEHETATIFMHLLNGVHKIRKTTARAVAGAEFNDIIDGIIALDHRASPGLTVTGNAQLSASGRIIVNSESGGVTENGDPIDNGKTGSAAFVSPFATVKAVDIRVVGGANRADRFQNIESGGPPPLKTGQLPVADPFAFLPTPRISNGVINVNRGAPVATNGTLKLNNDDDKSDSANYIETNSATGEETMVLHPGIYSSIDITGGKVKFRPGIYVLTSKNDETYAARILDGEIEANGVMFYNTKKFYDPLTGQPDASDVGLPSSEGSNQGQIRINAALGFSAIDTLKYSYPGSSPLIAQFNGMLIYQRRRSASTIQIQGFSEDRSLSGAIYAKWANLRLPAGGVLNSQIVVGTIAVPGHGDLFVKHDINDRASSLEVFLVE